MPLKERTPLSAQGQVLGKPVWHLLSLMTISGNIPKVWDHDTCTIVILHFEFKHFLIENKD